MPFWGIVELAGSDARDTGEEHPRDGLHQSVQLGDRIVVVLACEGDLVLGLTQFGLQRLEVGRRLQIGVASATASTLMIA